MVTIRLENNQPTDRSLKNIKTVLHSFAANNPDEVEYDKTASFAFNPPYLVSSDGHVQLLLSRIDADTFELSEVMIDGDEYVVPPLMEAFMEPDETSTPTIPLDIEGIDLNANNGLINNVTDLTTFVAEVTDIFQRSILEIIKRNGVASLIKLELDDGAKINIQAHLDRLYVRINDAPKSKLFNKLSFTNQYVIMQAMCQSNCENA